MPRPKPTEQQAEIEALEDLVDEASAVLTRAREAEAAVGLARQAVARIVSFWSTRIRTRNVYKDPGVRLRESHKQARMVVKTLERNLQGAKKNLASARVRYGHGRRGWEE